jgi:hypothetical protein
MVTKVLNSDEEEDAEYNFGVLDLVFEKIDKLHNEIQAECAEALTNINVLKKKAHSEIAAETATIEQAMQIRSENAEANKASHSKIVAGRRSWISSRHKERGPGGIHETLTGLQSNRLEASQIFKDEVDERNKAIDIIGKALFLVCLRFHSFKNTPTCLKVKSQPDVDEPPRYETKEPNEAEEETKLIHRPDTVFTNAWEDQKLKDQSLEDAPCPEDPTTCPVLDAMRGDMQIEDGKSFSESDTATFYKELNAQDSAHCAGACNESAKCKAFLFAKDVAKCKLLENAPDTTTSDIGFVVGIKPQQEGDDEQEENSEAEEDDEGQLNDSDFDFLQLSEASSLSALSYSEQLAAGELQQLAKESSSLPTKYATPLKELVLATSNSASKQKKRTVVHVIIEVLSQTQLEQSVAQSHHQDKLDAWFKESWALKGALNDERDKQNTEWALWQKQRSYIEQRIVASEVQRQAQEGAEEARKMIEDRIWEDERVYSIEESLRIEDLENLVKLNSLLRSAYDPTKPTSCPKTNGVICTESAAGWCVFSEKIPSNVQRCSCNSGFYGDACQFKMCPGLGDVLYKHDAEGVCSERGTGQEGGKGCDNTLGQCHCDPAYYHGPATKCEFRHAPPSKYESAGETYLMGNGVIDDQCSGHGTVDKIRGICTCKESYWGVPPDHVQVNGACETLKCPNSNGVAYPYVSGNACDGHGVCVPETGECTCSQPYFGHACESTTCPNDCSGNGECDITTGQCVCHQTPVKYSGISCELMECLASCNAPHGECNQNDGKCICKIGYSGAQSQLDSRCTADSLNTAETNWWTVWDKPGWIACPRGQLLYALRRSSCDALSCIDSGSCAAACEGESHVYQPYHCYHDLAWYNSMDHAGWSKCLPNYYVAGLYRSCESLYCLNIAKCCSLEDARWAMCGQTIWGTSFNNVGWSNLGQAGAHAFITGFKRSKVHTISSIDSASYCGFVRGY